MNKRPKILLLFLINVCATKPENHSQKAKGYPYIKQLSSIFNQLNLKRHCQTESRVMAMFETSCRFQVSGTVGQQVLVQTKTTTARFDWRLGPPCFWNFGSNKHCLLCSGKNESIQHVLILSLAILDAYKWEAIDMTFICFRTKTTIVKFKRKEKKGHKNDYLILTNLTSLN